ncbi:MAG: hypothetical protein ACI4WG_04155 [Erysipelotrichaceae bacterium]
MLKKHLVYLLIVLLTLSGLLFTLRKADQYISMPLIRPIEYLNEDEKAAREFDEKVMQLPTEVSISDCETIEELLKEYENLSDQAKAKVTSYAQLQQAYQQIQYLQDNQKAKVVIDMINNLVNSNNPQLVLAAQQAYDELTPSQQQLVTNKFILDSAWEELNKTVTKDNLNVGDVVIFVGGSVYISAKDTVPANTKGYSVCKVTYVSRDNIHPYHLVSTDGNGVYGWVDVSNIKFGE